ncbi:MAG: DUF4339 domain-containing protein [Bryobacteraceae bacterium]|nr:DUF4339 domain-containing protein [Bryobacteraceae bacterium]
MQRYYTKEAQATGPMEHKELARLVLIGTVRPETLVWREGLSSWQPLGTLPEFQAAAPSPPPLPASAPGLVGPRHYRYSGRYPVFRTCATAICGIMVADCVAWLYAYGQFRIPYIYICAILPFVFGGILGALTVGTYVFARIRSKSIVRKLTFAFVINTYYFHWAAWVSMVLQQRGTDVHVLDVALQPEALWATILAANAAGPWTLFGTHFTGGWVTAVWVLEGLIIVWLALMLPPVFFGDLPFCEACNAWCTKQANVARFSHQEEQIVVRAVEDKDFTGLAALPQVALSKDVGEWYQCDIERCLKCNNLNTLDVLYVAAERDQKGKISTTTRKLVENLLLTSTEAMHIKMLGQVKRPIP